MDLPQVRKRKKCLDLKSLVLKQFTKGPDQVLMCLRFDLMAEIRITIATARNTSSLRYAVYGLMKNKKRVP